MATSVHGAAPKTDSGDLAASTSADFWADYGLLASVNDINDLYVQDDSPDCEQRYFCYISLPMPIVLDNPLTGCIDRFWRVRLRSRIPSMSR